ncbi:hypothetical protein [Desulfoscipio gibsoniae]|uniref:Uncharacterized protein n=1 Tax=Desulfoscipio gibsoniae DSM 7213 TaxID=767817 RepID=R4KEL8_9FIRM|nr:hypothetical protein [Desulfoscipio gibsoniae]AGL01014.1 hypothetical protein Desgi_1532 [Desulfoscipio gibsoniae DSM 7213]
MRKITKRVSIGFVAVLVILVGASFIPTLWLKTANMSELNGHWINYITREVVEVGLLIVLRVGKATYRGKRRSEEKTIVAVLNSVQI